MEGSQPESPPRIIDGVTLRHFGITVSLSVLRSRVIGCRTPRWTETVRSEILAGLDQPGCASVLGTDFLGAPAEIQISEMAEVFRLQRELTDPREDKVAFSGRNLGEAESIFMADKLHGTFVTDDAAAYDFAARRLGPNRVMDTVDLLREAVYLGELDPSRAQQVADAIRNSGRHLRRGHPLTFPANYFSP